MDDELIHLYAWHTNSFRLNYSRSKRTVFCNPSFIKYALRNCTSVLAWSVYMVNISGIMLYMRFTN